MRRAASGAGAAALSAAAPAPGASPSSAHAVNANAPPIAAMPFTKLLRDCGRHGWLRIVRSWMR
jgi:hypothetical protein